MLLSCATCNQKCKEALFPIADETRRARFHNDDVSQETALLIQPALENPADHITFNKYTAVGVAGSAKGKETIDVLQLNRNGLVGRRTRWYSVIQNTLQKIVELENHPALRRTQSAELVADLLHELSGFAHPDAEFSAMARVALQPKAT
ncbi:MAG: hypothetical protein H7Y38_01245 [Armatimonadetes bacterium]|nr:hypothetical protein [Armatimonadota bacterium]